MSLLDRGLERMGTSNRALNTEQYLIVDKSAFACLRFLLANGRGLLLPHPDAEFNENESTRHTFERVHLDVRS